MRAARRGSSTAASVISADAAAAAIGSNAGAVCFSKSSAVPCSYPNARGGIRSMMRCGICRNAGSSVDITALIASRCRAGGTMRRTSEGTIAPFSFTAYV